MKHHLAFLALLAFAFTPLPAHAQFYPDTPLSDADASFNFDVVGASVVAGAGDVNGDGLADLLIGVPGDGESGSRYGAAYLILGREAADWGKDTNISSADAVFTGENPGDEAGISVCGVGDVNGDGTDDFIIGAHLSDAAGIRSGSAYLFFGGASWSGTYPVTNADVVFTGENSEDRLGTAIAAAGDVDGDGIDDILLSAPSSRESGYEAGKVYLVLGRASGQWTGDFSISGADKGFSGEAALDRFGTTINGISGDGDFKGGILIGAPAADPHGESSGKVYYYDASSYELWSKVTPPVLADYVLEGDSAEDRLGTALSNGEKYFDYPDVVYLVGIPGSDMGAADGGAVLLINAADANHSTLMIITAADSGEALGSSVSFSGDVYGFGYNGILAGAPHWNGSPLDAGRTVLVYGQQEFSQAGDTLSEPHASFLGTTAEGRSGTSVTVVGDMNGDGLDDFAASSYRSVWIFLGRKALVYPGDTNNDGIVDEADVLPLGVMFGKIGPERSRLSIWSAEESYFWEGFSPTYADADGNGIVDERDLIQIGVNWHRTHEVEGASHVISPEDLDILQPHEAAFRKLLSAARGTQVYARLKNLLYWVHLDEPVRSFELLQNHPNPFNPSTRIDFRLARTGKVQVTIYDITGAEVERLVDGLQFPAGEHRLIWNAAGKSSGIYFVTLKAEGFTDTRKLVLLK